MLGRLLLTGASGFVGHHAYPALVSAGWEVRCATRNAEERALKDPKRSWVSFDAERPDSVAVALEGATAVLYLFHAMGQEGDFEAKERVAAQTFARAAERRCATNRLPRRGRAERGGEQASAQPALDGRDPARGQRLHDRATSGYDRRRRWRQLAHGPRFGGASAVHDSAELAAEPFAAHRAR